MESDYRCRPLTHRMSDSTTDILGYCSPLSVFGGDSIDLKLSSNGPKQCSVELLRVQCADVDPDGPGEAYEQPCFFDKREISVEHQSIKSGSYAVIDPSPTFGDWTELEFSILVYPTIPEFGPQPVLTWGNLLLTIDDNCRFRFDAANQTALIESQILPRRWYHLQASVDLTHNQIGLKATLLRKEANKSPDAVARIRFPDSLALS